MRVYTEIPRILVKILYALLNNVIHRMGSGIENFDYGFGMPVNCQYTGKPVCPQFHVIKLKGKSLKDCSNWVYGGEQLSPYIFLVVRTLKTNEDVY